jgi:hypothetical protein
MSLLPTKTTKLRVLWSVLSMSELVFSIIKTNPGIYLTQLCRTINQKYKYYCKHHNCFLNDHQRKKTMIALKPDCVFPLHRVRVQIRKLKETSQIEQRREKRNDPKNYRGWDWMACYYPINHKEQIVAVEQNMGPHAAATGGTGESSSVGVNPTTVPKLSVKDLTSEAKTQ